MRINKKSFNLFQNENLCFHDHFFLEYHYDIICKEIVIKTEDARTKKQHTIVFHNVEGFEAVGGDSWGSCVFTRIIEWVIIEHEQEMLFAKIKNRISESIHGESKMKAFDDFFQTRLLFSTGNSIDIFCEYIEIDPEFITDAKNKHVCDKLKENARNQILSDCVTGREWLKDFIEEADVVFIEDELPTLFSENGVLSYSEYINELSFKVNINCVINLESARQREILGRWIWLVTKSDCVINEMTVKFKDTTVILKKKDIDELFSEFERIVSEV